MNILVIGDVMLDINYISKIERIAPEADILIHNITDTHYILGGASNVAFNLKRLDANVELISVIGNDDCGKKIQTLLEENNIFFKLFIDKERKTTQKNRIFHNNSIKVRYDIEDKQDIQSELEESILSYIKEKHETDKIDAIIISDYNKGVVINKLCKKIIEFANSNLIYTFIDPKVKDYQKYENCFCFKPNLLEGQEISGKTNRNEIMEFIHETIQCEHIVLTCGKEGLRINNTTKNNSNSNSNSILIKDEKEIKVVDVTGAGDIVLTVLVYIYLKTKNMVLAAKVANFAAGKSVEVIGNYSLTKEIIDSYFEINFNEETISLEKNNKNSKIIYDYEIEKIQKLSQKKKVVFTNGCFDILHSGHIKNLQFARNQGDLLVVGLNSDASIKRLKGETRPINDIIERSTILSLFEFVDYIIIFEEDSPLSILKELKPKILVKGSDYKKKDIIGSEYVDEIILFDYIVDKSTSILVEKVLKNMLLKHSK